jgi:chromate transporter
MSASTVSLGALFIAFLKVALGGFGSGVVWARRIAVEQRQWISEEEFSDILSLCQFMPGPNVIGIAVCVGARVRGLIGAIAAASGFVLIPLTIGFLLGTLYLENTHLAVLQRVLGGVSSVAAGILTPIVMLAAFGVLGGLGLLGEMADRLACLTIDQ